MLPDGRPAGGVTYVSSSTRRMTSRNWPSRRSSAAIDSGTGGSNVGVGSDPTGVGASIWSSPYGVFQCCHASADERYLMPPDIDDTDARDEDDDSQREEKPAIPFYFDPENRQVSED